MSKKIYKKLNEIIKVLTLFFLPYFYEVQGRHGWLARYVKIVDASERTIKFYQEIFDEDGRLIEIHEKYPENKGHIRVKGGGR